MKKRARLTVLLAGALVLARGAFALTTCLDSVVPSQACVYQNEIQRECCVVGFPASTRRLCSTKVYNGISAAYWTNRNSCEEAIDNCEPFTKSCP